MVYHLLSFKSLTAMQVPNSWSKGIAMSWTSGQSFSFADSAASNSGYGDLDLRIQPISEGFKSDPIAEALAPCAELEFTLSNLTGFLADLDARNSKLCLLGKQVTLHRVTGSTQPYNSQTDLLQPIYYGVVAQILIDKDIVRFICRQDSLEDIDLSKNGKAQTTTQPPVVLGDMSDDYAFVKMPFIDNLGTAIDLGALHSSAGYASYSAWTGDGQSAPATWGTVTSGNLSKTGTTLTLASRTAIANTAVAISATGMPEDSTLIAEFAKIPTDPLRVSVENELIDICSNIGTQAMTKNGVSLPARHFSERALMGTSATAHASGSPAYTTASVAANILLTAPLSIASTTILMGITQNTSTTKLNGDPATFRTGAKIHFESTSGQGAAYINIKTSPLPSGSTLKSLRIKYTADGNSGSYTTSYGGSVTAALDIMGKSINLGYSAANTAYSASGTLNAGVPEGFNPAESGIPITVKVLASSTLSLAITGIEADFTLSQKLDTALVKCSSTTSGMRDQLMIVKDAFDSRTVTLTEDASMPARATLSGVSSAPNFRELLRECVQNTALCALPTGQRTYKIVDPYGTRPTKAGPTQYQQLSDGTHARADINISSPDLAQIYTAVALNWQWNEARGAYEHRTVLASGSTETRWDLQSPINQTTLSSLGRANNLLTATRLLEFEGKFTRTQSAAWDLMDTLAKHYSSIHRTAQIPTTMDYALSLALMDQITPDSENPELSGSTWILIGRTLDPQNARAILTLWETQCPL